MNEPHSEQRDRYDPAMLAEFDARMEQILLEAEKRGVSRQSMQRVIDEANDILHPSESVKPIESSHNALRAITFLAGLVFVGLSVSEFSSAINPETANILGRIIYATGGFISAGAGAILTATSILGNWGNRNNNALDTSYTPQRAPQSMNTHSPQDFFANATFNDNAPDASYTPQTPAPSTNSQSLRDFFATATFNGNSDSTK